MNTITGWKCTSDKAISETRLSGAQAVGYVMEVTAQYRETETQVWEVFVPANEPLPQSAINPGQLTPSGWQQAAGGYTRVGSWICEDRGWDTEYSSPAAKKYTETWRKVGAWQTEV